MAPVFKTILNVTIWILFTKGLVLIPITLYTTGQAYWTEGTISMAALASCATGTFAFAMAGMLIWIKYRID